jgi:hypothetical protein
VTLPCSWKLDKVLPSLKEQFITPSLRPPSALSTPRASITGCSPVPEFLTLLIESQALLRHLQFLLSLIYPSVHDRHHERPYLWRSDCRPIPAYAEGEHLEEQCTPDHIFRTRQRYASWRSSETATDSAGTDPGLPDNHGSGRSILCQGQQDPPARELHGHNSTTSTLYWVSSGQLDRIGTQLMKNQILR